MTTPHRITDEEEQRAVIGERTNVKLGLIVLIIIGAAGGFGSQIWWAATTTTEVRSIHGLLLAEMGESKALRDEVVKMKTEIEIFKVSGSPQVRLLEDRVSSLGKRVDYLETKGSPAISPRVEVLEKELAKLREDVEMHKMLDDKRAKP